MTAPSMPVTIIPALHDNYIYLVAFGKEALVIDPGDADPVLRELKVRDLRLTAILNTHHHADHTGGNRALQKATGCRIIGPDDERVPLVSERLSGGEEIVWGDLSVRAILTPGHTIGDMSFYVEEAATDFPGILFSGDTLFAGGCGRVFEGTAEQLYRSLQTLAELPDETRIYCGHEYTLENYRFAGEILPDHKTITARFQAALARQDIGNPTIPSTIRQEKESNIFLLAEDPAMRRALDMPGADDVSIFTELRNRKNRF